MKFAFDIFDELLHLALHFFQPLPHVQNDFNAGKIDAEISSQIQNEFQPFEIFLRV